MLKSCLKTICNVWFPLVCILKAINYLHKKKSIIEGSQGSKRASACYKLERKTMYFCETVVHITKLS